MRILFVSAILPYPLYSGGQIRIYNLLKNLSRNHEITLFSFIRDFNEHLYLSKLSFLHEIKLFYRGKRLQVPYIFRFLSGRSSLLSASYENENMRKSISDIIKLHKFDLIHLEPFYVYGSIPRLNIPLCVGEHNVEFEVYKSYADQSNIFLRPILSYEASRIKSEEEKVLRMAKHTIAVSVNDAAKIKIIIKNNNVSVVENGVDTEYFKFKPKEINTAKPIFLYVGNYNWIPNRQAIEIILNEVWPHIKQKLPNAVFRIVGRSLPTRLNELKNIGVEIDTNVNDIQAEYNKSDILLAPMGIAGGSKFKILEAMAAGLPIITSKEGLAGTDAISGRDAIVANSSKSVVEEVIKIIDNPRKLESITKNARELIEKKYDWKKLAEKLDEVWRIAI
jgi:polysaccharide biosynthesis protein PslH